MKIEKAIEIGTKFDKGEYSCDAPTFRKVVKLGTEALKRNIKCRETLLCEDAFDLPGETEKDDNPLAGSKPLYKSG